jgi:hypothetical protein
MAVVDESAKIIESAAKRLDAKIAMLISRLNIQKNGRLRSDAISLRQAIQTRREIAREFGKYNIAVSSTVNYTPVLADVSNILGEAGLSKAISKADKDVIKILSQDGLSSMTALSDTYATQVASKVYSEVLSGGTVSDLTLDIRQLLIGETDRAGRPMVNHAKTIANTGYHEADAIIMEQKTEELGIEKFKYTGSLIKDSRDWCVAHKDQILTMAEIQEWDDQKWQGKKSGNPFITRGGWNCRHRWIPVVEEEQFSR